MIHPSDLFPYEQTVFDIHFIGNTVKALVEHYLSVEFHIVKVLEALHSLK